MPILFRSPQWTPSRSAGHPMTTMIQPLAAPVTPTSHASLQTREDTEPNFTTPAPAAATRRPRPAPAHSWPSSGPQRTGWSRAVLPRCGLGRRCTESFSPLHCFLHISTCPAQETLSRCYFRKYTHKVTLDLSQHKQVTKRGTWDFEMGKGRLFW